MQTGQGKPDQPVRYLQFERDRKGYVLLTIIDGRERETLRIPMDEVRQAADFAEQLARTAELVLVSDYPGH